MDLEKERLRQFNTQKFYSQREINIHKKRLNNAIHKARVLHQFDVEISITDGGRKVEVNVR